MRHFSEHSPIIKWSMTGLIITPTRSQEARISCFYLQLVSLETQLVHYVFTSKSVPWYLLLSHPFITSVLCHSTKCPEKQGKICLEGIFYKWNYVLFFWSDLIISHGGFFFIFIWNRRLPIVPLRAQTGQPWEIKARCLLPSGLCNSVTTS